MTTELETTARVIASYWHGGQASALYAFTSTGTMVPGLGDEISKCRTEVLGDNPTIGDLGQADRRVTQHQRND